MNLTGLSFNALPPIDLPFRFFLTAPIFMLACASLVFYSGPELWISRWQPAMLALTHGFTLGFLTMVMMGALLQLLPVIGGLGVAKPRLVASSAHLLLTLGCLCLMLGFMLYHAWLLAAAAIMLGLSFTIYCSALVWILLKKLSQGDSIIGFRLALISLMIVIFLGLTLLARSLGFEGITGSKQLTDIHGTWGLLGWAGILIIAVSFQVIPMFHVAPAFAKPIRQYLIPSLFLLLMTQWLFPALTQVLIPLLLSLYAINVITVTNQRKRKVPDTTIQYWQLSAYSLLMTALFILLPDSLWKKILAVDTSIFITAFYCYFFLLSVLQGMLLKILPFLSYTHLQQYCLTDFNAMQYLPHMHEFLNKRHGQWLFKLHLISGFSLLWVLYQPNHYWLFALTMMLEFSLLLALMIKTVKRFYEVKKKMQG
jgi:hypothetical protein